MDLVLNGLHWTYCLVYLDDVIVFGRTFDEHLERLREVLLRLRDAGLTLKLKKCHWAKTSLRFLGHVVSDGKVRADPEKVKAVEKFPVSIDRTGIRAFLGLTSFYRCFIPDYAEITLPLTKLLKTKRIFEWTDDCQKAFEELKVCLLKEPVLRCPDFDRPFIEETDACDYGLGSVLAQDFEDGEAVISYASRQLKPHEIKYAPLQRKLWQLCGL